MIAPTSAQQIYTVVQRIQMRSVPISPTENPGSQCRTMDRENRCEYVTFV